jgi:chemotaxis protein MotA
MDIATVIGIIIAGGGIIWAMFETTHGNMGCFYSVEGVVVVIAGSFAAACMAVPLGTVLDTFSFLKKWLCGKEEKVDEMIRCLVGYAEVARRDGMLALEEALRSQKDPFLQKGLQLAIDGTDPEIIEETLSIEMDAQGERHRKGKKFFEIMGAYGPGFGLMATVIGQIAMFQNLGGDTAAIGQTLGVALCATLYGCIIQNAICGPIGHKLAIRSEEERFVKEMALVGIMSIQSGDNPHVVEIKLHSFLSDRQRKLLEKHK